MCFKGIWTLTLTNPIWVSKTRLIVQSESSNLAVKSTQYNGMLGEETASIDWLDRNVLYSTNFGPYQFWENRIQTDMRYGRTQDPETYLLMKPLVAQIPACVGFHLVYFNTVQYLLQEKSIHTFLWLITTWGREGQHVSHRGGPGACDILKTRTSRK